MLPTSTLYKLTTKDATSVEGYTGNYTPIYTEWGEGVEHAVPPGGRLYTDQVLHAYRAPMIAVFMDPLHGDYTHDDDALLWECEGDVCTDDGALVGCTRLRALRRIPLPALTLEQRIDIAIRAARVVSYDEAFRQWAIGWLSGRNRSPEAARAVRETMPEVATEAADEAAQAALRTVSAPLWAGDLREAVIRSSAGEAAAAAAEAAMAKGVRFDLLDICRQHVARRAVS